jgi:hypothetical protein
LGALTEPVGGRRRQAGLLAVILAARVITKAFYTYSIKILRQEKIVRDSRMGNRLKELNLSYMGPMG